MCSRLPTGRNAIDGREPMYNGQSGVLGSQVKKSAQMRSRTQQELEREGSLSRLLEDTGHYFTCEYEERNFQIFRKPERRLPVHTLHTTRTHRDPATLILRPGYGAHLDDDSFLKITSCGTDQKGLPYVKGHLLLRQSHPDLFMPSRENELVAIFRIDEENLDWDYVEVMFDPSRVSSICTIFYTNHAYDSLNYTKHVRGLTGPPEPIYFCRYMSANSNLRRDLTTQSSNPKIGKIEHFSEDQAEDIIFTTKSGQHCACRTPRRFIRAEWRGRQHCKLSGSHTKPNSSSQQYTFGEPFCGAGGVSLGAYHADLKLHFAFDRGARSMETYRLNFEQIRGVGVITKQMKAEDFVEEAKDTDEFMVDFLHLSPPCQPFSGAKTGKTDDTDKLGAFGTVEDLVKHCKPRIATLEEVARLTTSPKHREKFEWLIRSFILNGYSLQWKVLKLWQFGVPQARVRLIIIASG